MLMPSLKSYSVFVGGGKQAHASAALSVFSGWICSICHSAAFVEVFFKFSLIVSKPTQKCVFGSTSYHLALFKW